MSSKSQQKPPLELQINNVVDFTAKCFSSPLYKRFDINENDYHQILNSCINSRIRLEMYCPRCKKEQTFITIENDRQKLLGQFRPPGGGGFTKNDVINKLFGSLSGPHTFTRTLACPKDPMHFLEFIFTIKGYKLFKIGQYPSQYDLENTQINKYREDLSTDDFDEFKRATSLYSHSIGIGSFVYLRRILERLIENAHQRAKTDMGDSWDEAHYERAKMDEKITRLGSDYLPTDIVNHYKIYQILSKGIHQLSEKLCITAFPVLKHAIELILDEILAKSERENKINSVREKMDILGKKLKEEDGNNSSVSPLDHNPHSLV